MSITANELRQHLEEYLALAGTEDVYITQNGVVVAKLCSPNQERIAAAKSLLGVLRPDITLEEAREQRLSTI